MIRFGFFYLNGRLTVYDVSTEWVHGRQMFVAALSEDPRICFRAIRPENAIEQLKGYMADRARAASHANVTWLPNSVPTLHAS